MFDLATLRDIVVIIAGITMILGRQSVVRTLERIEAAVKLIRMDIEKEHRLNRERFEHSTNKTQERIE